MITALQVIQHFESLELEAYPDPGSDLGKRCTESGLLMRDYRKIVGWETLKGRPWTGGWGHTGPEMHPGYRLAAPQWLQILRDDISIFSKAVVRQTSAVRVAEYEFQAFVSLTFNIGSDEFHTSTLLRKYLAGDKAGAAAEFPKWCHSGHRVLKGLVERREMERKLFLGQI